MEGGEVLAGANWMMRNRVWRVLAVGTVFFCGAMASGAEFIPLGKLRPTDELSDPLAVSADGTTVVGYSHTGALFEAVRWTFPSGIETMGAGQPSLAYGVSSDGSVIVGGGLVGDHGDGFRWTAATGLERLGDLPGGAVGSSARDVSADGSVVVGSSNSDIGGEAFRWTAASGMVGLGTLPGGDFGNYANGVSADGSVVIGNARIVPAPGFGDQAFRWTQATGMVPLGDLPGGQFYSEAFDVSADGSVVVGRSIVAGPLGFRAFRWTEGTGMVQLPPLGSINFEGAEGVSGDGRVIVGAGAFVWDEFHGTRSLRQILMDQGVDLNGWQLHVARAASFDGLTIVGFGRGPGPVDEAWIARLDPGTFIPEPTSISLLAAALVALLCFASA
jgi:probable HAF family extracellular repeat protein